MAHYLRTQHMHVYSVEEVRWKGFILPLHRPSPRGEVDLPSTSSAHPVDYRLEQKFTSTGELRQHPQDLSSLNYQHAESSGFHVVRSLGC